MQAMMGSTAFADGDRKIDVLSSLPPPVAAVHAGPGTPATP